VQTSFTSKACKKNGNTIAQKIRKIIKKVLFGNTKAKKGRILAKIRM